MLNIRSKVWRQSLTLVFIESHSVLSFRSVDYSDTKKRKHPSVTDDNTVVMKKTCKLGITAPETPSFVRYALSLFDCFGLLLFLFNNIRLAYGHLFLKIHSLQALPWIAIWHWMVKYSYKQPLLKTAGVIDHLSKISAQVFFKLLGTLQLTSTFSK